MNGVEVWISILVLGVVLGLFIAYSESRIDKDIWKHVRILCAVAGAISIVFFVYFVYMVWYFIGLIFFGVVIYEPHEEKNKYSSHNGFQFRGGDIPHRFRRPYSRREEEPQLEEWL